MIFLKDNESQHLIGAAEYTLHDNYPNSVACIASEGLCPACESGIKKVPKKLIAFLDTSDGKRKVFECTPKQFGAVKQAIADFTSDGSVFDYVFKLFKSGEKASTTVGATPIMKPTDGEKQYLQSAISEPIAEDFFDRAIGNPTADWVKQKIAGYTPATETPTSTDPTKQF